MDVIDHNGIRLKAGVFEDGNAPHFARHALD